MFEGFQQPGDPAQRRRLAASGTLALAAFAAVTAAVIAMAATDVPREVAKKVQVAFRPPPPPVVEEAPPPPRAPPPAVPKNVKVVEVEGLPPPAPLVAPDEVPQEALAEAEPTGEPVVVAVAPGSGGGNYGGATIAADPSPRRSEPVHLPEAAAPPQPLASNRPPEYPEESRASGREGLVILKIIIDEEGRVRVVSVLRGEEPFASAATRAVQTWRYRPATLDGSPISIYRTLKLPFRIRS